MTLTKRLQTKLKCRNYFEYHSSWKELLRRPISNWEHYTHPDHCEAADGKSGVNPLRSLYEATRIIHPSYIKFQAWKCSQLFKRKRKEESITVPCPVCKDKGEIEVYKL